MPAPKLLDVADHSRDSAGLRYVYPVVSRRAGGVSVGVNLNPDNRCNWRCIYCQVPDLRRGMAPPVDLGRLDAELRGFLDEAVRGDFLTARVPEGARRLSDVALSGNGEPTSAREFPEVVRLIGRVLDDFGLLGRLKLVLITNGSLMGRAAVQEGIAAMAGLGGEVWFKLDRATSAGIRAVNSVNLTPAAALRNLGICAARCPTWIQTCVFAVDGAPPPDGERAAYLAFLRRARDDGVPIKGVLLYGLARPSTQPEAPRLGPVPAPWFDGLAQDIAALGLPVKPSP